MRHVIVHVVIIIVCLALIGGMFAYIAWMESYIAKWKGFNVEVSPRMYFAIHVADFLGDYWYVPVAILLGIAAISVASLCRR
jgi:hypothetical protein